MRVNKTEEQDFLMIAEAFSLPVTEVRRAVHAFFGTILRDAASLPFADERRIYSHDLFGDYGKTWNIPGIGRIGPLYSRYLKWRANEAKASDQVNRRTYRERLTQSEIEAIADDIFSGRTPSPIQKKKQSELYDRVWMVGRSGKRTARQAIPKKEK